MQQRARALERHRDAGMLLDGALERVDGRVLGAGRGREKAAAALRAGERRRAIERPAALLEPADRLLGGREPARGDERFDLVGHERDRARLADAGRHEPCPQRGESLVGVVRAVEEEIEQRERPLRMNPREGDRPLAGERERALGIRAARRPGVPCRRRPAPAPPVRSLRWVARRPAPPHRRLRSPSSRLRPTGRRRTRRAPGGRGSSGWSRHRHGEGPAPAAPKEGDRPVGPIRP